MFRYRIDSDEPQHLHVVWGWTHGLLQYRDVFDNHMPLFQMLCAPLLRVIGERPESLIFMRVAMLPLYAAMIALTWGIASSCYPRQIALWSTIIAALVPGFLLCSTEFRTDDLWAFFWFVAIAILVRPPLTSLRVLGAGLALGLAAAVSAKTTLLLFVVAVGALVVLLDTRAWRRAAYAPIFLLAFVIPPAAVGLYFAARGAWQPFFYDTIVHNVMHHFRIGRLLIFPCFLALIGFVGRKVVEPRRRFLFVIAHVYAAALFCLWPIVEHEHWMPYYPLAAVTLVPLFLKQMRSVIAVALVEIVLVIAFGQLWRNDTPEGLAVIEQTLQLTAPNETVMDLKGETVFRRRAFFYVLEPLTKHRIRSGRIADTIISDMLRTHTMVVVKDQYGFPRRTRAFLARNFVSVGAVRVAGQILQSRQTSFRVEVPAEYAVLREGIVFHGSLDGRPYDAPRFLAPGVHSIEPADGNLALLWARAAARGLSPFSVAQTFDRGRRTVGSRRHYAHSVGRDLFGIGAGGAGCSRKARAQDGSARQERRPGDQHP